MELSEQAYITEQEHCIVTYRQLGYAFSEVAALLDLPGGAEQAEELYAQVLEKAGALCAPPSETVEERVGALLEEMGVSKAMPGADALAAALAMAVRKPELLNDLKDMLYPDLGRALGVKPATLMPRIRRVLHTAYRGSRGGADIYRQLGISCSKDLSAAQFLKTAVRYLNAAW